MILGAIADDLTGATDLAMTLRAGGLRTIMVVGVPQDGVNAADADAVVVALKSRTIPSGDAVRMSLDAARTLRDCGASRYYFKYCSTFDSTPEGNIGPVAEALLEFAGGGLTVACPAFPATGRTVYAGHLFVNEVPLDESPMRDHPLTPMRDSSLVRLLAPQTKLKLGRIGYSAAVEGEETVRREIVSLRNSGVGIAICDAISDAHLKTLGSALADLPLLTGASGLAVGLPEAYRSDGLISVERVAESAPRLPAGRRAILSGSCSRMTLAQVDAALRAGMPAFRIDPVDIDRNAIDVDTILAWVDAQASEPILIYTSAPPAVLARIQAELGADRAAALTEATLAGVAQGLVARAFNRLIVAGGETSGAVIAAIGVRALDLGEAISPGVTWAYSRDPIIALALKSGNFGDERFFLSAWDALAGQKDRGH